MISICFFTCPHVIDCFTASDRWNTCQELIPQAKSGEIYNWELSMFNADPYNAKLIRIVNGSLYYDWPWSRKKFDESIKPTDYLPFQHVLNLISDIQDSVFFTTSLSFLRYDFPFISLAHVATLKNLDFPLPTNTILKHETILHNAAFKSDEDLVPAIYWSKHSLTFEDWIKRINKVLFSSDITLFHHRIFDSIILHPELFEVSLTGFGESNIDLKQLIIHEIDDYVYNPWNPEPLCYDKAHLKMKKSSYYNISRRIKYLEDLVQSTTVNKKKYNEKDYRYMVIVYDKQHKDGKHVVEYVERVTKHLVHSGLVLLLQISDIETFYSNRLIPWVHYVPITHDTADIVKKIIWLQNHDRVAYRIVQNARIFGESYLRLEDYYCYIGRLLHTLGGIYNASDAIIPFDPIKIELNAKY